MVLKNLFILAGFAISAYSAFSMKWSLQEFCWITWMTGIVYTWICIFTAMFQIVLTARREKELYQESLPFASWMPSGNFVILLSITAFIAGSIAFIIYNFIFGFYGVFLSFFAEMYPYRFFGRDGFINSNFFTPVIWLIVVFWTMPVGTIIARKDDFFGPKPWRRLLFPLQKEIIRMHILTIGMPLITLLAYFLFKRFHEEIVITVLLAVFYFLPGGGRNKKETEQADENDRATVPEERPAAWSLTTDGLMKEIEEGKRKSVTHKEMEWAKEYERSLMPADYRYPQFEDIYESLEDQTISYLTAWTAPFTGDGKADLYKGEKIRIHTESRDEKPVGVYAVPVEYEKLHERMVPEGTRKSPKYGGFYFYFGTKELNEKFRLIKDSFRQQDYEINV